MPGVSEWQSIANTADPDELRERILTGYKDGKPFTPYVPTIPLPAALDWVLDFGCGLGRNFSYLKSISRHVVGFDIEAMIERCRSLATEHVDLLTSDWSEVTARQFDLIFAALVLQHLETDTCRACLAAFAQLAPLTYVLTRLQSDFGVNVFGLIKDANLFEVEACTEVEHDSRGHQLRQVGRASFSEISRAANDKHYELLLRSRVHST